MEEEAGRGTRVKEEEEQEQGHLQEGDRNQSQLTMGIESAKLEVLTFFTLFFGAFFWVHSEVNWQVQRVPPHMDIQCTTAVNLLQS